MNATMSKTGRMLALAAGIGLVGMLAGCNATRQSPSVMPPITPPQAYHEPEERYENPGSLYAAAEQDGLFADTRARRVGDIVMVKVVENHKAKNKTDITNSKQKHKPFPPVRTADIAEKTARNHIKNHHARSCRQHGGGAGRNQTPGQKQRHDIGRHR